MPAAAAAFDPDNVMPGDTLALRMPQNGTLSGEYKVDGAGRLAIMSVGRITVGGLSISEAETKVQEAVAARLGLKSGDLFLDIAVRQPVLVLGGVTDSGPVEWQDGMVVVEAIARAGGFARPTDRDATIALEQGRLAERVDTLRLGLAETLLTLARLDAEEAGADRIAVPAEAGRLVDAAAVARVAADQAALRDRRRKTIDDRLAAYAKEGAASTEEAKALEEELVAKRRQTTLLDREIGQLAAAPSGVIAGTRFIELDRRKAEVDGDIAELIGRIARTRRDRIELDRQIAALREDFLTEVRTAGNEARSAAASLRLQLDAAVSQLGVADVLSAYVMTEEGAATVNEPTVMRREDGAFRTFAVTLTTELRPGDVLRIPAASRSTPRSAPADDDALVGAPDAPATGPARLAAAPVRP